MRILDLPDFTRCRRLWKDEFIRTLSPQPGITIGLGGGTADIAFRVAAAARAIRQPGEQSDTAITVCDINEAMLAVGRQRAVERGEGRTTRLTGSLPMQKISRLR